MTIKRFPISPPEYETPPALERVLFGGRFFENRKPVAQHSVPFIEYNGQIVVSAAEIGKHNSLELDGLQWLRPTRRDEEYLFRPASFLSFRAMPVSLVGSVDLGQWHGYAVAGDCEMHDWDDRANREDCWRDWWRADWIEPERDDDDDE